MRIDRIDLFHIAMPLLRPWRTAYGEDSVIESVLCRLSSGDRAAWGESCPLAAPTYSPEWAGGVFEAVHRWLGPAILGHELETACDLQSRLNAFRGNSFAKGLLDSAWWNLEVQRQGVPLHRLLGAARDMAPVGADLGVADSLDELLDDVDAAVRDGFPRLKLKFRPGWDLPIVRAVRERHPGLTLHIDCNGGYSLRDIDLFQRLDEFQLAMIEQPLAWDDLLEHAELGRSIRTPICLDESLSSVAQVERGLKLGSAQVFNLKPARLGGLTNAVRAHDLCAAAGATCWVGGMLESSIGVAQCAALAMLDNCTYPADIFPSTKYYAEELGDPPVTLVVDASGTPAIRAPLSLPEPRTDLLRRFTLRTETLSTSSVSS
ncbi:MAG: o-succinylbenzoate synthase [Planctomyces sp.]|nr:o-succinylbenzoate synthase [Planctomyces sp.]